MPSTERDSLLGKFSTPFKGKSQNKVYAFDLLYHPFGQHQSPSSKKNVIFMVTDGMGPASVSLARSYRQYRDKLPYGDVLTIDKHFIGSSRTRSSDSLITDSAAGATAFSCGLKSYNGAIGVTADQKPCGTVLEALKLQGYLTGLVVTTRITDATPAAFSSHVKTRWFEDLIAQHQIGDYPLGRMVDLMIGGGRTHFYPPTDTKYGSRGSRADDRNLIDEAIENGWSYIGNRSTFDEAVQSGVSLPLMALLEDGDIPFDLDRDEQVYPSLEESAKLALETLSKATKDSEKGFFLMIEGSRIDHAGHNNDPAAQVNEVLAYDKAFAAVLKFADESDVETIIVSTSDHETGGLATARQISPSYPEYVWFPEVLYNVQHSGEYLSRALREYEGDDVETYVKEEIFERGLGFKTYTAEEVKKVVKHKNTAHYILNELVSLRSETGWSTHGHSAVDVNIYAYSNRKVTFMESILGALQGNRENTEIGQFLQSFTGVTSNVEEITELIKDTQVEPAKGKSIDVESVQEDYHKGLY
ncbi:hypothetical protein WICPIJ_002860 [Wickerhamomyces pijperi]|uniref:Alkaline phosphatase n=1 Tax=Wickerhamomyces pijperi TaxID=599730 RepID=A0A9P8TPR8_WICPI|nr:hypothetical protein WICPIJ_002860 [Wickerhamomyces pijperi]